MVFFLYGPNTFLSVKKLNEIIEKYRSKHKSGFNFIKIEPTEDGIERLQESAATISMFKEKKLIIIENLFSASKSLQEKFLNFLNEKETFTKKEDSVIVFEKGEADKRTKTFKELEKKSFKKQEFLSLSPEKTKLFIQKEIERLGGKINYDAIEELIIFFGSDLWQIENEIQKLISYKDQGTIEKKDVQELGVSNIDLNIFETIEAISKRNKNKALKLIADHLEKGENEIRILSMINYQFRNIIKIKSLIDEEKSFFQIQTMTKLHPFVVKKTFPIAKNFSMQELKKIYKNLLETDFSIKTGKIEPRLGLEMFIAEI